MNNILKNLRDELLRNADEKVKKSGMRYFRENVNLYGIRSAVVEKIGKEYFKYVKDKSKTDILSLCEELWKSGFMEESFIACNWSYNLHKIYEASDFEIFDRWVNNYVSNWASCDTLCNHSVGTLVEMYPHLLSRTQGMGKIGKPMGEARIFCFTHSTGQERKIP